MPDYIPAMKKVEVEETRKKLDLAYSSKAMAENIPILLQVLTLRQGESLIQIYFNLFLHNSIFGLICNQKWHRF